MGWERKANAEIYELYGDVQISDFAKSRRLQWLGPLKRMKTSRNLKSIARRIPEGKRKRRKLRKVGEKQLRRIIGEE